MYVNKRVELTQREIALQKIYALLLLLLCKKQKQKRRKRNKKSQRSGMNVQCLTELIIMLSFIDFTKQQCPRQHLTLMPRQRKGLILVVTYYMVFTNIPKAKCNNHTDFELNWTSVCKENITFDFIFCCSCGFEI